MTDIPLSLVLFFGATTLVTLAALAKAARGAQAVWIGAAFWLVLQSAIALAGFYLKVDTVPPRILLGAGAPPLLLIAALFLTERGRRFLDGMDLKWLVLFHSVRVLVEINLYLLFVNRQVPALLTFEAGNLDILVGLTASTIWWAFSTGRVGRTGLLVWNALSVLSLLNAVVRALLSAPFRFQRLGFDQPNVAIVHFPFVLLLAFIVPSALLCHLAIFRRLRREPAP